MTMIHAWVLYPILVIALSAGWGVLIEKAAGREWSGMLLIPLGMVAVIVVSGFITAFSGIAKAATPVCAVGAVAGLAWGQPWRRLKRGAAWPALAALGAFLVYGAPVLLYGHPTWLGYLRLDDSSTWFNIIDHIMSHGRPPSMAAPTGLSTYDLVYSGDVGPNYPFGAFQFLGVSHQLAFIDEAWVFDPCMAMFGAGIALAVYDLAGPFIEAGWRKAIVAFLAAQPALLYGYYLWGGLKEVTGALVVICGVAVIAPLLRERAKPDWLGGREMIGVGACAGALLTILSVGAGAWMLPAGVALLAAWLWADRAERGFNKIRGTLLASGWTIAFVAAFAVPLWIVVKSFLGADSGLFSAGQNSATQYGNLIYPHPLRGLQLFGIWTTGDFRLPPSSTFPTYWLVYVVIVVAAGTIIWTVWRERQFGLALLTVVALAGVGIFWEQGSSPWVLGKSLAVSSPAVIAVALIGAGILWQRVSWAGVSPGLVLIALFAFGILWSNERGYHNALLAPYERMAELEHIGQIAQGDGPMFINDYEVFADRHFDRAEAPVEPAEYREALLPTTGGRLLTKSAYADIDSFGLQTLLPYRSIVTRNSPVESRPPSLWKLKWSGAYYQLWVRPANPTESIIEHIPLGDQAAYPFCGAYELPGGGTAGLPVCSIAPAAVPTCSSVMALAAMAARDGAELLAYERPDPIVIRGDNVRFPFQWAHDTIGHTLTANTPGTATGYMAVASTQRYKLWLGGVFTRGFDVSVDGHSLGLVANQISDVDGYVPVATIGLKAGIHTVKLRYPTAGIGPGAGDNPSPLGTAGYTQLEEIALQPTQPAPKLVSYAPSQATALCGQSLDWIEIVKNG